ncbi:MAG: hypothetical protein PF488_02160 [Patescibacteria group bacterium]|jgi:hypothetical protein|nr:hypothetical protein [Patescibacteria group bacterium]
MKKGKNALIIFSFLVLALLIFLVLVPGAVEENGELENEGLENEVLENEVNNENTNLEVDDENGINLPEEEENNTEVIESALQELREEQVRTQIDTYSPVKEEDGIKFDVTSISWTGDNVAEVEYEGEAKHKAEIEFAPEQPTIILVTQIADSVAEEVGGEEVMEGEVIE